MDPTVQMFLFLVAMLYVVSLFVRLFGWPTAPAELVRFVAAGYARLKGATADFPPAIATGPERVDHVLELLAAAAVKRYPHLDPDGALERHLVDHLHSGYYVADVVRARASDTPVSPDTVKDAPQSGQGPGPGAEDVTPG